MPHIYFKFFSVLIIIALSVIFQGCTQTTTEQQSKALAVDSNVLRVGVSTNAPPLIYKENGQITGLEADFASRFAEFLGKKLRFVEVEWSRQLDYLNQGKIDIVMSGMSITKERQFLVDFALPYLRSGQIMLTRLEDYNRFSSGITSVMNTNYAIGTVANTTGDIFITQTLSKANEIVFKTSRAAVEALINKDIDVFVYDAPMVCYYAGVHHIDKLRPVLKMETEEYLAWAVRKSDGELKEQANNFLQSISQTGELKQMISKRIPYL